MAVFESVSAGGLPDASLEFLGTSKSAQNAREFITKAASVDHTVILRGETGTGKDHTAELIHQQGRRKYPFVPVDCGLLPIELSESELFGHAKGAFTGADTEKKGLVEIAHQGTLFFNEIANMSLSMQAKFLRVLEKRSFRPVGGTEQRHIVTRIIVATNADLEHAVETGAFRADLYHRLNVLSYRLSPLRERPADVPVLAKYFLARERKELGVKILTPEATEALISYHWPGNIRELSNVVIKAAFASPSSEIWREHVESQFGVLDLHAGEAPPTYRELLAGYFKQVLVYNGGSIVKSAAHAKISRGSMADNVQRFGLESYVVRQRGIQK